MRQARFIVSLNKVNPEPVTVTYATQDFTATAPEDYTAKTGTLTFAPGEMHRSIIVLVRDDLPDTGEKEFHVVLSNPVNASLSDIAHTGSAVLPGSIP